MPAQIDFTMTRTPYQVPYFVQASCRVLRDTLGFLFPGTLDVARVIRVTSECLAMKVNFLRSQTSRAVVVRVVLALVSLRDKNSFEPRPSNELPIPFKVFLKHFQATPPFFFLFFCSFSQRMLHALHALSERK